MRRRVGRHGRRSCLSGETGGVSARSSAPSSPSPRCSRSPPCCCGSIRAKVANAAKIAAEHLPAVERAYVFGGPTDLFLLHDQASVRLAMQNYGKTPAVIRGVAGRVRGPGAARGEARHDKTPRRRWTNETSNCSSCSRRRRCSARKSPRRSSSWATSPMRTCSGSRTRRGSVSGSRATAKRPLPATPKWNVFD